MVSVWKEWPGGNEGERRLDTKGGTPTYRPWKATLRYRLPQGQREIVEGAEEDTGRPVKLWSFHYYVLMAVCPDVAR